VSDALSADPAIDEVVRIARRRPVEPLRPDQQFRAANIVHDDLRPILSGCDAVVHSAWAIHPMRSPTTTWEVNVAGTRNVLRSAIDAGVGSLVYMSSVGAYASRIGDAPVDEHWPTAGPSHLAYAREKVAVEHLLDSVTDTDSLRIVRLRPTVVLKAEAATQFERYFIGSLLASVVRLVPRSRLVIPLPEELWVQVVHTSDVAEAVRLALLSPDASGAFNLAAPEPLDRHRVSEVIGGLSAPIPAAVTLAANALAFQLRLVQASPGWLEMALRAPILDCTRAADVLGWHPQVAAREALAGVVRGIKQRSCRATPPLGPSPLKKVLS
jgi:UDP-glucose 4-epimerase